MEQKIKRYNLALSEEMFESLREISEKEHAYILQVIRSFIKIGLMMYRISENNDTDILLKDSNGDVKSLQIIF